VLPQICVATAAALGWAEKVIAAIRQLGKIQALENDALR
jgi:hypothetical protein